MRSQDYLVNITTTFVGNVTISSPLFTLKGTYQGEFISMLGPDKEKSYARVEGSQEIVAGGSLDLRVYLRDKFGNKDLMILKYYNPETSKGIQATIFPREAG